MIFPKYGKKDGEENKRRYHATCYYSQKKSWIVSQVYKPHGLLDLGGLCSPLVNPKEIFFGLFPPLKIAYMNHA